MPTLTWTLWNLFLAIIPVATAYLLAAGVRRYTLSRQRVPLSAGDDKGNIDRYPQFQRRQRVPLWAWLPLAVVWFAFLPNSCYLLTEWRHFLFDPMFQALRDAAENNALYMVTVAKFGFFFLLYSLAGVLCFTLAIRPIERLLREM